MISRILIKDFKCFKNQIVNFENISLLVGPNSGGKSSVIQALLLFIMSFDNTCINDMSLDIISNKYGINLYSFLEVLYHEADYEKFTVSLYFDNSSSISTIEYTPTDDNNVVSLKIQGTENKSLIDLIYLGADRSIAREQKSGNIHNIKLGDSNEYLGYIIEKGQKNLVPIEKKRNHWDFNDTNLLDIQINNWLNYILPGNKVTAKNSGSDNYISVLFGDKATLHHTNVGYGISFVLPIIVAGLIAKKNTVLVIENPELHLHPKAQSCIAAFLATVAKSGVQVIIETHSDHIINGFRKAVLNPNIGIKNTDLNINFFNITDKCIVEEVKLNDNVEINHWPDGFMDQEEKDLFEIRSMRLKR